YIGMAKRYYEGAKRTKQEKPEVVVGKGSETAGIKRPQAVADVIAEIGDSLDGTQGRIAQDDAKVEGSNSVWTTDNNGEEYTSVTPPKSGTTQRNGKVGVLLQGTKHKSRKTTSKETFYKMSHSI
ncbi:hypothetical protein Tco_0427027, partial [Tanacetum coccineum]